MVPQGYITSEVMECKIDPIAEFELNEICYQWFDYTLKGKNKPDFPERKKLIMK